MKLKKDGSVLIGDVKVYPKWQWSDWYYKDVQASVRLKSKWRHDGDDRDKQIRAWAMMVHGSDIAFKLPVKDIRVHIDEAYGIGVLYVTEEDELGAELEDHMSGYRWYQSRKVVRKGEYVRREFKLPAWLYKGYVPVDVIEETVPEEFPTNRLEL